MRPRDSTGQSRRYARQDQLHPGLAYGGSHLGHLAVVPGHYHLLCRRSWPLSRKDKLNGDRIDLRQQRHQDGALTTAITHSIRLRATGLPSTSVSRPSRVSIAPSFSPLITPNRPPTRYVLTALRPSSYTPNLGVVVISRNKHTVANSIYQGETSGP